MTDQQALAEAERRWGKKFPNRVFCCRHPTHVAGVIECPGDAHQGFSFTGHSWEEVFKARYLAALSVLYWKVRAVYWLGRPVVRVVDGSGLAQLEWDDDSNWAVRLKRTPRRRRHRSKREGEVPTADLRPDPTVG
jgi:hypothetical protein